MRIMHNRRSTIRETLGDHPMRFLALAALLTSTLLGTGGAQEVDIVARLAPGTVVITSNLEAGADGAYYGVGYASSSQAQLIRIDGTGKMARVANLGLANSPRFQIIQPNFDFSPF